MASIVQQPNGRRLIQLSPGEDPRRPKIALGKITKRQAETVRVHIEKIIARKCTGEALPAATAEWLAGVPDSLRKRLEQLSLAEPQQKAKRPTLAAWVGEYIEKRVDVKPNTKRNMKQAERSLNGFFGNAQRLDEITAGDAEDFRIRMKAEGLAEGTIRRRCKRARQFLTAAIKKGLIAENPFADIPCGNYANAKRFYFVSREEAAAVLDACPGAEWRLIFALARFGGLRVPSEIMALRWGDIDWERKRFAVHSSKTEHHDSAGIRQVPLFPELEGPLRDCFEQAEPGTEYVITRNRTTNANLRTQLNRIIKRAGLTPWPKLFQNCRSTRETELAEEYPLQVVTAWIGNSELVAAKFYLQVTPDHYAKAVQERVHDRVHQASAPAHNEPQEEDPEDGEPLFCGPLRTSEAACGYSQPQGIPPRGLEQESVSADESKRSENRPAAEGAESGASHSRTAQIDPDLAGLAAAWPSLPATVKADILALAARSAGGQTE